MALTTINSGGVKDDSIVNADIKSDAAIAGTKVAPDFGSQNIATTGGLTVDTDTLKVDATNNRVGVGTASPGRTLDVDGIIRSDGTSGALVFGGNSSTPSEGAAIHRPAADTLAFVTNSTEKARITSSGFIGAGTASPNHMLQLHRSDSNNSYTQYTNSTTGSASGDGVWLGMGGDEVCYLWQNENNHMVLGTNNSERLRIKSDGNIIPGTNNATSIGDGTTNFNSIWASTRFRGNDNVKLILGDAQDLQIWHDGSHTFMQNDTGQLQLRSDSFGITDEASSEYYLYASKDSSINLYYDGDKKFGTTSYGAEVTGRAKVSANVAADYAFQVYNDGDNTNRYGILIQCGKDNNAGTNYALGVADGDGGTQGYLTFNAGTLSLVAFTAAHPCIIPDADNPSDSSMAYPYGTLLETISIQYSQKNGADTERGIRYKVQKTQSANSRKVLGAYGSSMNGGPEGKTNEHQALVLGDGHILVNNAGGNIEVGDGICSSATAGIGQKATANPSMIIGIAQEAITFTGTETKLVAVQYGLQQFTPWT